MFVCLNFLKFCSLFVFMSFHCLKPIPRFLLMFYVIYFQWKFHRHCQSSVVLFHTRKTKKKLYSELKCEQFYCSNNNSTGNAQMTETITSIDKRRQFSYAHLDNVIVARDFYVYNLVFSK